VVGACDENGSDMGGYLKSSGSQLQDRRQIGRPRLGWLGGGDPPPGLLR
jgi:hypothetical protein